MDDEDSTIDGILARALNSMGTSDRETLVHQLALLLGDSAPTLDVCAFFLDMTDWNVQRAYEAFHEHGMTNNISSLPTYDISLMSMQLVNDVTIGEGESIPPSTRFTKSWVVRNNGHVQWPEGTALCYMEGDYMQHEHRVLVERLQPGVEAQIWVEMTSPSGQGIYQSRWQLNTPQGLPFGESIWCIITVDESGILDITQQLAGAPLGARLVQSQANPFDISRQLPNLVDNNIENDETTKK